jgi:DNA-binding transcriptional MerR regulator
MDAGRGLQIGEIARRAGIGPKVIRFYEARGLLPPPARGPNRYRLYTPEAVDLLRFIKQAQGIGLTLDEIKAIIAIRQGGQPPCAHVHRLLEAKRAELDRKLDALLMLRRRLDRSLAAWRRRPRGQGAVCPHIEAEAARGGDTSDGPPRRARQAARR